MLVGKTHYKTIWREGHTVKLIDQTLLPFRFSIAQYSDYRGLCMAIRNMNIRGAGAIGAAAGYAMALAFAEAQMNHKPTFVLDAKKEIESTRPTARNLFFATEKVWESGKKGAAAAFSEADRLAAENEDAARAIGEYGMALMFDGISVNTHCNAGWLGFVDWGSALAPVFMAHRRGMKVYVYVDETRPRLQGARLTAWELENEGIAHTILPDHAGAWLFRNKKVDLILTGADRIAMNGDVANKIGTFEKAIVAKAMGIPFYVAAPLSTFDPDCSHGDLIPIEHRDEGEVLRISGIKNHRLIEDITIANPRSHAINPAFDVTPASLITGLITEQGIIEPKEHLIKTLFDTPKT
jgi:S-methyl-5-thioribose-1-phosphate isomerase